MKRISAEEYSRLFSDLPGPEGEAVFLSVAEENDFALPRRKKRSHKYSYGRALIIAGSTGFSGAPVLAANACERSGAGLTQLVVPETIYPVAASRCDGAVVTPMQASEDGGFSGEAFRRILPLLRKADACVVGPGLGLSEGAAGMVGFVLQNAECPLVLDADALTVCGRRPELLASCRVPLILTPHEGEFRRLGGDLSAGRLAGALEFAARYPEAILVLKGHGTLVCHGREMTVNPSGSPAMAKGGSGDVLCGVLCALLAQGFDPLFSARCAVWLHGTAGDLACSELGEYCVTPSDLIRSLPAAFGKICEK
ncbi:MAG: NAD(P)H-hydrate dehydratase [Oscillospiraceae bacterium]|nr:NAD(P)H-hydrate dehydratase [Oscillospiraceae bacterium]